MAADHRAEKLERHELASIENKILPSHILSGTCTCQAVNPFAHGHYIVAHLIQKIARSGGAGARITAGYISLLLI